MAQETRITLAPEVEEIAQRLIRQYHQELLECTILYCFTTAAAPCIPRKCNPELRFAYSIHLPGCPKAAVEEGPDFRLFINVEEWSYLLPGQHEPYIFHRLLHIGREATSDGGIRWVLMPHSYEDHDEVIKRFGLWSHAAKRMGQIIQPELDLGTSDDDTRLTLHVPGYAPVTASIDDFRLATDALREEPLP